MRGRPEWRDATRRPQRFRVTDRRGTGRDSKSAPPAAAGCTAHPACAESAGMVGEWGAGPQIRMNRAQSPKTVRRSGAHGILGAVVFCSASGNPLGGFSPERRVASGELIGIWLAVPRKWQGFAVPGGEREEAGPLGFGRRRLKDGWYWFGLPSPVQSPSRAPWRTLKGCRFPRRRRPLLLLLRHVFSIFPGAPGGFGLACSEQEQRPTGGPAGRGGAADRRRECGRRVRPCPARIQEPRRESGHPSRRARAGSLCLEVWFRSRGVTRKRRSSQTHRPASSAGLRARQGIPLLGLDPSPSLALFSWPPAQSLLGRRWLFLSGPS